MLSVKICNLFTKQKKDFEKMYIHDILNNSMLGGQHLLKW